MKRSSVKYEVKKLMLLFYFLLATRHSPLATFKLKQKIL